MTIAKHKRDPIREDRIENEVIVDAYGPEEQAMGWYYYLEDKIRFSFQATCIAARRFRPSSKEKQSKSEGWHPKKPALATCSCSSNGKAGPWRSPCLNCKPSRGTKQPMKPSRIGITGWLRATCSELTSAHTSPHGGFTRVGLHR